MSEDETTANDLVDRLERLEKIIESRLLNIEYADILDARQVAAQRGETVESMTLYEEQVQEFKQGDNIVGAENMSDGWRSSQLVVSGIDVYEGNKNVVHTEEGSEIELPVLDGDDK